jgi:hypothetical protein
MRYNFQILKNPSIAFSIRLIQLTVLPALNYDNVNQQLENLQCYG